MGGACTAPPTSTPPASSRCRGRTSRRSRACESCERGAGGRHAPGDARAAVRGDPRPLRVPPRRHLRRLERQRPARDRRRASARTSSTSRWCCCAAAGSPPATSPATCGPRPEDDGADSLEVDTHAWLEALLPGTDGHGEPVWVSADPTNRRLARRDAREDRPRPLLRRRPARQGPLHGRRQLRAEGGRHDVAAGPADERPCLSAGPSLPARSARSHR